ncbi:hypothetical protein BGZ95_012086 [Linnemannia exigua]|uniref:F-box domain-containing protein n=1 Tax=Linnemannia exigua TaxID=604196 RepID=A0AAD4H3T1_9FUNG|nr:hypothetical protein BGZ95_012086 [Linnemannia exigua]
MAPPPSESFFSIPELIDELAPYLVPQDLLQLLKTSRQFYSYFTPYFWLDVTIDTEPAFLRLIRSPEACAALYRNLRLTRSLKIKADFLLYYIEGLYLYMDTHPEVVLPHPHYLRRPHTTKTSLVTFVPFPPLTQLVRLDVSTATAYPAISYTMADDPTRASYYPRPLPDLSTTTLDLGLSMCWFISLNPGLTHLTLRDESLQESHLCRVFARTVSRLSHLRQLLLSGNGGENMPIQSFLMIMLTCPPTLEILQGFNYGEERIRLPNPDLYDCMELDVEGPLEVRQQPLLNLRRLKFPWNTMGYTPDMIQTMMKICPNIEAMDVPLISVEDPESFRVVAKTFMKICPHIQELSMEVVRFDYHGLGILPIMEEMEANTLQVWAMGSFSDLWKTRTLDVIQRHSETMREVRFPLTHRLKSSTIQGILTSCRALEHLEVGGFVAMRVKLWLDDMEPDTPWVCTRLRYLKLTVDWNDKRDKPHPPPEPEPTVRMSLGLINDGMNAILASRMRLGNAPAPPKPEDHDKIVGIMARAANERRRTRLARFYKQLGRLTNLEVLDLRATSGFPEEEPTNVLRPYTEYALPRLLSLFDNTMNLEQGGGKEQRGKVGYLSELGQLRKLRELRGSFRIDRPTVKANMGQREVEFMHEHWPELRMIELLPANYETREDFEVPSHIQWFMEQRPFTKMAIPLPPGSP